MSAKQIEIRIEPVDGKTFRCVEGGGYTLVLNDTAAFMSGKGWVENAPEKNDIESDDIEDLINGSKEWKKRQVDFHYVIRKDKCFGTQFFWSYKEELFVVTLAVQMAFDWEMYFASRSEAIAVQEKILNWLTS